MSQFRDGLENVARALKWDNASAAPALWLESYEQQLRGRFSEIFTIYQDDYIAESFLALSAERQRFFLRAHSVAAELLKPRKTLCNKDLIAAALLAELTVSGMAQGFDIKLWTANGDRCFNSAAASGLGSQSARIADSGILLDFCSPYNFGSEQIEMLGYFAEYECNLLQRNLGDAVSLIRACSVEAYNFLRDMLDVVAVRKTMNRPSGFSSGSFDRHARMALFGFGSPGCVDCAQLANALVHESIHSFLFMIEEVSGRFVNRECCDNCFIRSPWTGRQLRSDAYVHACIVWYGLYWFWRGAPNSIAISPERRAELQNWARRGFFAIPIEEGLQSHRNCVSNEAIDLLKLIGSEIRKT